VERSRSVNGRQRITAAFSKTEVKASCNFLSFNFLSCIFLQLQRHYLSVGFMSYNWSVISRGGKNNRFFDASRFSVERFQQKKSCCFVFCSPAAAFCSPERDNFIYLQCVWANLICLDTIAIQPTHSMHSNSQPDKRTPSLSRAAFSLMT
jgi:hypothetical protein